MRPRRGEIRIVGRIARKAGARQPILHHVEGLDHHGGETRPPGLAEEAALIGSFAGEPSEQAALRDDLLHRGLRGHRARFGAAVILDCGAAAVEVGVDVDGDDDPRTERTRGRYRHRIDQRAIHQPAPANADRRKHSGQCVGGACRFHQWATRDPDFVAGLEFRRYGGKAHGQLLNRCITGGLKQLVGKAASIEQRRAAKADIEIAEHAAAGEAAAPGFDAIEIARRVAASDHGADRRTGDDVRNNSLGDQAADNANMREPACGTTAQHQPDRGTLREGLGLVVVLTAVLAYLASGGVIAILSTAEKIEHPNTPSHTMLARGAPRARPARRPW